MSIEDRALGAFLGVAIGDAFGATVEFLTEREIKAKYGIHDKIIGGGWLNLQPGQVTDDTDMSLAVARSLVRCQGLDLKDMCEEFAKWLATGPKDVGNTCRRGIRRFMVHGTVEGPQNDGDAGNGAAMRLVAIALATLGDEAKMADWTIAHAHTTHHHPLSDIVCVELCRMTQRLILGASVPEIRSLADDLVARHRDLRFDPFAGMSSAYIVDTAKVVFDGLFQTDNFENCLIRTVNRGGDADTTGAIVGMLAGAAYGAEALPKVWSKKVDKKVVAEITELVPKLLSLAPSGLS